MAIQCVVLDFDGTFTDVEAEAGPFSGAFQQDVQDLVGRDITKDWERLTRLVADKPAEFGWEYGGQIVAPANADPYVRATCVSQLLFSEMGILKDAETRSVVLQAIYQKSYKLTRTAFRPDAAHVLRSILGAGLPVFVVTNAHTGTVQKKLKDLGFDEGPKLAVLGEARKFVITPAAEKDARFEALPEAHRLASLPERPVHPRRGKYFDALKDVWARSGAAPESTLVCGDIFELDLLMPSLLGMHVHMVARPDAPPHEKTAVEALGAKGAWTQELAGVLGRLTA